MKRKDLPKTITSPITGNILTMHDIIMYEGEPNVGMSIAYFYAGCTECFDPSVVMYWNENDNDEKMYISVEWERSGSMYR